MSSLNPSLLQFARTACREKLAFTPPPDQSQMGQPPQGGGVDPSQMAGIGMPGDGANSGGGSGSSGGAVDHEMMRNVMQQELQKILPALGGGAGGAMGPGGKPMKLDVGVELHRLNVMLAKIIDALGIQIPASDMVTTEEQAQQPGDQNAQMTGSQSPSAISPIQPMAPAGPTAGGAPQQPKTAEDEDHLRIARRFIDQGECDSGESILPLSSRASALTHIMQRMPNIEDRIA